MGTSARRTREEGEELARRFKESGATQREFAKSEGINISTLQYWLRKKSEASGEDSGRFIELMPGKSALCQSVGLTVNVGRDVTMRFATLPPATYLAALSRELKTC